MKCISILSVLCLNFCHIKEMWEWPKSKGTKHRELTAHLRLYLKTNRWVTHNKTPFWYYLPESSKSTPQWKQKLKIVAHSTFDKTYPHLTIWLFHSSSSDQNQLNHPWLILFLPSSVSKFHQLCLTDSPRSQLHLSTPPPSHWVYIPTLDHLQ